MQVEARAQMVVRRLSAPLNRQVVAGVEAAPCPAPSRLGLVEAVAVAQLCIQQVTVRETHRHNPQRRGTEAELVTQPPHGRVVVAAALAKPETPMGQAMAVTAGPAPSAALRWFMRVVVEARMTMRHCPVVTVAEGLVVERLVRQQRLSQGQMVLAVAVAVVVRPRLPR